MANITCAISGLRFTIPGLEGVSIPANTGYYHPVFTLPYRTLDNLYYQHTRNLLNPTDSYLLFCAFLHNTGQVDWQTPAACNPNAARTKKLVQNNLAQLIAVYQKTSVIKHPSFKQPSFVVAVDNCGLDQVHNWIEAWHENLLVFNVSRATYAQQRDLAMIEKVLDEKLDAGVPASELPAIVANWASQAGEFPADKEEAYTRVIRSCFNSAKMFNTPLPLIKEVQEYCFANIEPGSIHAHTLFETLKEGAHRHLDYLGGGSLALGYTILDTHEQSAASKAGDLKTEAELNTIANSAPLEEPIERDYPTKLAFLKARLAYRVASAMLASPEPIIQDNQGNEL